MNKPLLEALCQVLNDKVKAKTLTLSAGSTAFTDYKGVKSEINVPMGMSLQLPKFKTARGDVQLFASVRGKEWEFPLSHPDNADLCYQLGVLISPEYFEGEGVEGLIEFLKKHYAELNQLLSTFEQGQDMYMQERIPGWGKFKVRRGN